VFSGNLAAVLDRTGVAAARGVVDLGAGTGAGSRLLRDRFPDAKVTCIDNNPGMLELLRGQGFAVVEANLDDGFPSLSGSSSSADPVSGEPIDLVWASSSLHHIAQPDRLLAGAYTALAAGGTLAVVELHGLPLFLHVSSLEDPQGASLEQRCHAAAAAEGWNHYPDWTPAMQAAGFTVTKSEVTTVVPVTEAARGYAQQWFARFAQLAGLTADDRSAVKNLLDRFHDLELEPRATRTVWVGQSEQEKS